MANTGAGSDAGSGAQVSAGFIEYTLGKEPCTGTGITWTSDELDDALASSVTSILADDAGLALIKEALMPLSETGFVAERVSERVTKGVKNWRVGEAIAEAYLTDRRECVFPWPMRRDARRQGVSLPGADLVGFAMEGKGYRLVFGEVKTSSQMRYPPGVMNGESGLRQQIKDLRDDVDLRDGLIEYLTFRSPYAPWRGCFIQAVGRYLNNGRNDVRLYGVLIRDVSPDDRDLKNSVSRLINDCPAKMNITFIAIYLPEGRVKNLSMDVLALMEGDEV